MEASNVTAPDRVFRLDVIYALLKSRDGRLWVGTSRGLCLLVPGPDPKKRVVARLYTTRDGLPSDHVQVLFQASEGRMWVGVGWVPLGAEHISEFIPDGLPNGKSFRSAIRSWMKVRWPMTGRVTCR